MTKVNYTDQMVATAQEMYAELGNEGLQKIADELGRSVQSVRGKLVQVKSYKPDVKPEAAPRDEGPTKAEILEDIALVSGMDVKGLASANKAGLTQVLELAHMVAG